MRVTGNARGGIQGALRTGAAQIGVPARKPRILIVGAGIAGLALAASLERFGITPVSSSSRFWKYGHRRTTAAA
jgi:threonine dehydrogenase-like Zn-dependent dehydrogenase